MTAIVTGAELFLPLADLINLDEERARLEKELEKFEEVERVQKKLSNQGFVAKALQQLLKESVRKSKIT